MSSKERTCEELCYIFKSFDFYFVIAIPIMVEPTQRFTEMFELYISRLNVPMENTRYKMK